jgi:hypothetical protein
MDLPPVSLRTERAGRIPPGEPSQWQDLPIKVPFWCSSVLHQEERWVLTPSPRLPETQHCNSEELLPITTCL